MLAAVMHRAVCRRAGTIDKDRLGWQRMRASTYVEDRRGQRDIGAGVRGPRGAQLGVGVVLVLGVLAVMTGVGTWQCGGRDASRSCAAFAR